MDKEEVLQKMLNHFRDEIIGSVVTYYLLADYSLKDAEKVVKTELPFSLQAPSDYRIKIYDNKTGEIEDRSQPLDLELADILLLLECRRYMETRKDFLSDDELKEFEEICKDMDKRNIKKI